jgi:cytochrome P450
MVLFLTVFSWTTGPVVRVSPYELDISDIDAVKEIHRVGGQYRKSEFYDNIGHRSVRTLFSTTDPHYHAIRRRLLSAGMAHTNLSTLEPSVSDRVQLTINQMASEMKRRGTVDVFKWWTFMATDVIGELSFGQSFQTLEHGEVLQLLRSQLQNLEIATKRETDIWNQKTQYVRDLENISSFMAVRVTFPKLVEYSSVLPIPIFKRVRQAGGRMAQYAQRAITNYQSMIEKNPENPKQTLFTKMFKGGPDGLTLAEITPEAGGYIVAGSDTTAITLTYLVWAVCRKPAIRDKLVAEVNTLPPDFNMDHVRDLPFLNQVIHEALRLHSAVPSALPRAVPPGGAHLAGYNIPGGITVSTQAYTLHRNDDVFPKPHM